MAVGPFAHITPPPTTAHTQNLWYHSINWQISTDKKATAHKPTIPKV
jgi:hypothetical protein